MEVVVTVDHHLFVYFAFFLNLQEFVKFKFLIFFKEFFKRVNEVDHNDKEDETPFFVFNVDEIAFNIDVELEKVIHRSHEEEQGNH